MAVLSDARILELVQKGGLIASSFKNENVTPNGYDITVGSVKAENTDESERLDIPPRSPFWTSSEEVFNMPRNVAGEIFIRSSLARKGILGSFGFIDAGYRGALTLAFFNGSSSSILIERGNTIAQIVFLQMEGAAEIAYGERSGHYQDKQGINL